MASLKWSRRAPRLISDDNRGSLAVMLLFGSPMGVACCSSLNECKASSRLWHGPSSRSKELP